MNDLVELLRIALALGLVATPPIIIARLIAGPDRASLADLLAFTTDQPRPRGVQEEDLPALRFDQPDPIRTRSGPLTEREPAPVARVPSPCVDDRAA